ncbi:hypothetical protein WDW89_01920 [Deltaproteobacteria bacterium TL4]
MDNVKAQFYHAQAMKLDLKRKWQSMAVWPIVYRFGNRVKIEFEYCFRTYRIDLYIPSIKLAIEVDEHFHECQQEEDTIREKQIIEGLGCEFVRIKVRGSSEMSFFEQVAYACDKIQEKIDQLKLVDWSIVSRNVRLIYPSQNTGYSEAHLQTLEENEIPKLVEEMMKDLDALGIEVLEEMGPVTPSNGELGFSIQMPAIKFCVSIRANQTTKLLVTEYSENILIKLNITLDGPKRGKVDYWVINEMKGRFDADTIVENLGIYKQLLDS